MVVNRLCQMVHSPLAGAADAIYKVAMAKSTDAKGIEPDTPRASTMAQDPAVISRHIDQARNPGSVAMISRDHLLGIEGMNRLEIEHLLDRANQKCMINICLLVVFVNNDNYRVLFRRPY